MIPQSAPQPGTNPLPGTVSWLQCPLGPGGTGAEHRLGLCHSISLCSGRIGGRCGTQKWPCREAGCGQEP